MAVYQEGDFIVCEVLPTPYSWEHLSGLIYVGDSFEEAKAIADADNIGRDNSHAAVCRIINGAPYRVDRAGNCWKIVKTQCDDWQHHHPYQEGEYIVYRSSKPDSWGMLDEKYRGFDWDEAIAIAVNETANNQFFTYDVCQVVQGQLQVIRDGQFVGLLEVREQCDDEEE